MTLNEIYDNKYLSVRAYNVCRLNNLYNLDLILNYYSKKHSFRTLRNCGDGTNNELINFCKIKLEKRYSGSIPSKQEKKDFYQSILKELTRKQREVISSFIVINIKSLSIRAQNAVKTHLRNNLKAKNFILMLLSLPFDVSKIKNVGRKSFPEIVVFIQIVKEFIDEVSQTKNENELTMLRNSFLIQKTFSVYDIPNEILESESIFLLTDFLLNRNRLFDETQTIIVQKSLKLYENQKELTLDDIAAEVSLSRERVRKIRKICVDDLFDKLLFTQNFNDDLFQKYNIDINSNQIEINTNTVEIINASNETNLSQEFITYILFVYLADKFSLIANIEDVIQPKYFNASNRHNWNNFYLIKKELATEIDFNALANDIDRRISDKIEESYNFNFKSYLSRFLTSNNIEILDLAFPIAEKIMNDEFELYLDLDENLIFKRNTFKQVYEYAYEALEELRKPSKLNIILDKVKELNPNYASDESSLRAAMARKNGFVPIGRNSIFGLKKWENEIENFKGGTIRNIAEEYLSQFTTPKHISDITTHVLKYRPKSNLKSILQNLKLDESGSYVFFKDAQIGLSYKNYEDNFKKLSEVKKTDKKSWEESFQILKQFIDKYKRLPYSSGCPESEQKIYRWYNNQKKRYYSDNLTAEKREKFKILEATNNRYLMIKLLEKQLKTEELKGANANEKLVMELKDLLSIFF